MGLSNLNLTIDGTTAGRKGYGGRGGRGGGASAFDRHELERRQKNEARKVKYAYMDTYAGLGRSGWLMEDGESVIA